MVTSFTHSFTNLIVTHCATGVNSSHGILVRYLHRVFYQSILSVYHTRTCYQDIQYIHLTLTFTHRIYPWHVPIPFTH